MLSKLKLRAGLFTLIFSSILLSCSSTNSLNAVNQVNNSNASLFATTNGVIPFPNALQRKWGSAVVADLDQNGWEDVITTQHGTNALIYWNDNGKFTQPTVLIKGDTHGLAVSDYDGDGEMNIVVAQGGGDGGNPRRPVYFSVSKERKVKRLGTFDHFRASRGRSMKFLDSNGDTQLDLFATGFAPKKVKALTTNQLYSNNGKKFTNPRTLTIPRDALSVKALTTDVNNDGLLDIFTYGGRDMTLSVGQADGSFKDSTQDILGELANLKYVNNITEIDYDNDGDFDLFLVRSPYQFEKEAYYDPVDKNFAFFVFRDKFMFDNIQVAGDSLVLKNIQETYATYDIQLGKNRTRVEATRDTKYTGGTLTINAQDAQGWPTGEKLKGLHIGYMGNGNWRIGGFVKSRLSAVVTNVTSQPAEIKRKPLAAKLLENRNGKFVDVTTAMGINITEQTTSAAAGDFNNDGYVDLAISPYGNMALPVEHFVLMNNAGQGFSKHPNSGLTSQEIGATGVGVTTIDFDQDGRLDIIYGNERGRWYLAKNQLSADQQGNFVTINVSASPKNNAQPVGARVSISACGKQQVQLVGSSGDGFHQMLNNRIHFGLGDCSIASEVNIKWSNGESKVIKNVKAGTKISV
ncbi:CRTAC1 family protein [Saccharobesus litoralis]|uniref:CRTAC1 family protein n=1 Tax=Saccharobesus litoralis TaxID=2172099 RepID=A0A2S0VNK3_9ALTE|nr:FG-GAP-like repeat-containing protein [Saccharobesus litoralis]AWB65762.1 CRTAC1 family protein [Saccharobesus litoralis]